MIFHFAIVLVVGISLYPLTYLSLKIVLCEFIFREWY